MAERRFYWLKLSKDFFRQLEIKKLRMIAGGDTYVIIYLKLLLLSLDNDGKLYYDGIEDDFCEEMALATDEATDNVTVTVNFLMAHGILCKNAPDEYELTTCADMTGSEASSTRRSRKCREKQKTLQSNTKPLLCNGNATIGNTEIEKETKLEKEKKQRREDSPASPPAPKEVRHQYGEYKNVLLTDADLEKLKAELPGTYQDYIERLSRYMASKGVSYKSHLATIRNWARKDAEQRQPQQPQKEERTYQYGIYL